MINRLKHWTDRYAAMGACKEGFEEARQYDSLQAWWDATQRGDWMAWVLGVDGWPDGARAEYERVAAPARAEYERVAAPARAEYERTCADVLRKIVPTVKQEVGDD